MLTYLKTDSLLSVSTFLGRFKQTKYLAIAQFRYFNIQPKLKKIDITTRLRGLNPTNSIVYDTPSLVLRSTVG